MPTRMLRVAFPPATRTSCLSTTSRASRSRTRVKAGASSNECFCGVETSLAPAAADTTRSESAMVVQAVQVQSVGPGDRSMVHRHVREELWVIQRGEHRPSLARDELERPDQAVVEVQLKRVGTHHADTLDVRDAVSSSHGKGSIVPGAIARHDVPRYSGRRVRARVRGFHVAPAPPVLGSASARHGGVLDATLVTGRAAARPSGCCYCCTHLAIGRL
jgi:hypothetical protein